MANSRGAAGFKNLSNTGKQPLLPPKSPFPSIGPSYADYGSSSSIGTKGIPKPREVHRHHQRTSSESFLVEEPPSWLDDLLNEPETPVRRGSHRRSSSDSFAYLDTSTNSMIDPVAQEEYKYKNVPSVPSWGCQDLDHFKDMHRDSFYTEGRSFGSQQNRGWESSVNSVTYTSSLPSTATEKQEREESGPHDLKGSSERKDGSFAKPASEADAKKAKQQFAQRSRVRKLQYIADLERNVQALQAEGSGVSAELEFLDQQNLILNMENRALKQRLDSLTQEQLIKYMEHEMLEREIARLRVLYHQQQQQQQPPPTHNRSRSRDLDSQFTNLSLKHKDANCSRDPVSGPLHI